ncbi:MAG: hypothetical protein Kow0047_13140 [Anaerolineae bacterium]
MSATRRIAACLAYLLPVVGWIYTLVARRRDRFAMFHTRQAIGITLIPVALTALWAITGWLLAWLPFGAPLAAGLFSLVVAAYIVAVVDWVIGLVQAALGLAKPVPILGGVALRIPLPV